MATTEDSRHGEDQNEPNGQVVAGQRGEMRPFKQILSLWRTWVVIFTPLILLPLPILYSSKAGRCAYGVGIMAIYWMTEAIPMAVTALLPIVIMPWLGVVSSKELSTNYLKDTNMLFFGGLIVAVAVERWNLHKRIALRVLLLVGSEPRWLMFGFMITTAFLSMWISNTATTAMMVPIAQAVLSELKKHRENVDGEDNPDEVKLTFDSKEPDENFGIANMHISEMDDVRPISPKQSKADQAFNEMCKGLTLCVAYAANIGGTATLTGTGPNLVMKGQVDTLYGSGTGINFSSWFIYSFPNMVVTLFFAWWWLQILFLGCGPTFHFCKKDKKFDAATVKQVIRNEYNQLGPFSFAEMAVLGHFILLALLWLTREPEFIPGWAVIFPEETKDYVTDASVAITIAVSLFIFPSRKPNILCFRKSNDPEPGPVPAILDWETIHNKMAWGVVLVLGGGFALAKSCQVSGLSSDISDAFSVFSNIPVWVLVVLLCTITATFTEVTSNVATATIFLPILAELAEGMSVNPLYLLVPTTVSTSFAFMLPVATPPNAIVFAYGNMKIIDMVKAGIVMNIMCIIILTFSINTWGYAYYNLGVFPDWANDTLTPSPAQDMNSTWLINCTKLLGQT